MRIRFILGECRFCNHLSGLFNLGATPDQMMKVRHASRQATENATNTPLKGIYGLSPSAKNTHAAGSNTK
jgi:hypothetical protein